MRFWPVKNDFIGEKKVSKASKETRRKGTIQSVNYNQVESILDKKKLLRPQITWNHSSKHD